MGNAALLLTTRYTTGCQRTSVQRSLSEKKLSAKSGMKYPKLGNPEFNPAANLNMCKGVTSQLNPLTSCATQLVRGTTVNRAKLPKNIS